MSDIYRKVSVRVWADERFASLTPLKPSGQALWLYLLTGPHTGQLPGVFVAGRAAMAEALGWDQVDFDAAMTEVLASGMAEYDPKTRLWLLPKAISHNLPASPNVVKSWRKSWSLLPECPLRDRAAAVLASELEGLSEGFMNAFTEVIDKPFGKAFAKASLNQEQEQQQEREQEKRSRARYLVDFAESQPIRSRQGRALSLLQAMKRPAAFDGGGE